MNDKNSKKTKFISYTFYLLLFIFLVFYLKNIDLTILKNVSFNYYYLITASFVGVIARFWGAYSWVNLLTMLSRKSTNNYSKELYYVYAKSWLSRYLPISGAWVVSKVYFASKLGISKYKLTISSIVEAALQMGVVLGISLIFLSLDPKFNEMNGYFRTLLYAVLGIIIIILIPKVFNYVMSKAVRLVKKKELAEEDYVTSKIVIKGAMLFILWSLLMGLAFYFVTKSVYPVKTNELFYIMAAANIAGIVSMLAFFAPGGVGVREGVQLLLLSAVMPKEYAVVIVILTRVWSVIIDLMFLLITYLINVDWGEKHKS